MGALMPLLFSLALLGRTALDLSGHLKEGTPDHTQRSFVTENNEENKKFSSHQIDLSEFFSSTTIIPIDTTQSYLMRRTLQVDEPSVTLNSNKGSFSKKYGNIALPDLPQLGDIVLKKEPKPNGAPALLPPWPKDTLSNMAKKSLGPNIKSKYYIDKDVSAADKNNINSIDFYNKDRRTEFEKLIWPSKPPPSEYLKYTRLKKLHPKFTPTMMQKQLNNNKDMRKEGLNLTEEEKSLMFSNLKEKNLMTDSLQAPPLFKTFLKQFKTRLPNTTERPEIEISGERNIVIVHKGTPSTPTPKEISFIDVSTPSPYEAITPKPSSSTSFKSALPISTLFIENKPALKFDEKIPRPVFGDRLQMEKTADHSQENADYALQQRIRNTFRPPIKKPELKEQMKEMEQRQQKEKMKQMNQMKQREQKERIIKMKQLEKRKNMEQIKQLELLNKINQLKKKESMIKLEQLKQKEKNTKMELKTQSESKLVKKKLVYTTAASFRNKNVTDSNPDEIEARDQEITITIKNTDSPDNGASSSVFTSVRVSKNQHPDKLSNSRDNKETYKREEEFLGDGFDYPNNGEFDNIKIETKVINTKITNEPDPTDNQITTFEGENKIVDDVDNQIDELSAPTQDIDARPVKDYYPRDSPVQTTHKPYQLITKVPGYSNNGPFIHHTALTPVPITRVRTSPRSWFKFYAQEEKQKQYSERQFSGGQITERQFSGGQLPGEQITLRQFSGGQFSGGQLKAGGKVPGGQITERQFSVGQVPDNQFTGGQIHTSAGQMQTSVGQIQTPTGQMPGERQFQVLDRPKKKVERKLTKAEIEDIEGKAYIRRRIKVKSPAHRNALKERFIKNKLNELIREADFKDSIFKQALTSPSPWRYIMKKPSVEANLVFASSTPFPMMKKFEMIRSGPVEQERSRLDNHKRSQVKEETRSYSSVVQEPNMIASTISPILTTLKALQEKFPSILLDPFVNKNHQNNLESTKKKISTPYPFYKMKQV